MVTIVNSGVLNSINVNPYGQTLLIPSPSNYQVGDMMLAIITGDVQFLTTLLPWVTLEGFPTDPSENPETTLVKRFMGPEEPVEYTLFIGPSTEGLSCVWLHLTDIQEDTPIRFIRNLGVAPWDPFDPVAETQSPVLPNINAGEPVVSVANIFSGIDVETIYTQVTPDPYVFGGSLPFHPSLDGWIMGYATYTALESGDSIVATWTHQTQSNRALNYSNYTISFGPEGPPEPEPGNECFNHIKKYLPTDFAWKAPEGSDFQKWLCGFDPEMDRAYKSLGEKIWGEWDPETTSSLSSLEEELGLNPSSIRSMDSRRNHVRARRSEPRALGPGVIERKLRNAGFDAYVYGPYYEFYTGRLALRNPGEYVTSDYGGINFDGKLIRGGYTEREDILHFFSLGEYQLGEFQLGDGTLQTNPVYLQIPKDPKEFTKFIYIGGANIDDYLSIDLQQKEEFEELVLQAVGAHLWVVLRVRYVTS